MSTLLASVGEQALITVHVDSQSVDCMYVYIYIYANFAMEDGYLFGGGGGGLKPLIRYPS